MIEINHIIKSFGEEKAVNDVSFTIKEGEVFGLIGTNGAGKSTLLRMMAGIIKPDSGEIKIEGKKVYRNAEAKKEFFFLPDEVYFFPNASAQDMGKYYKNVYKTFDGEKFEKMLENFSLDKKKKIAAYSKGMQKQIALLIGICAGTKYLYCDEIFDGLDPVMRQGIKSIFSKEIEERNFTPIITSHNLREQEDICDYVGFLHKGSMLLSQNLLEMKCNIQKVQCVFVNEAEGKKCLEQLEMVKQEQRGSLYTLVVKGEREAVMDAFGQVDMTFLEMLPLTLEEIFISETEVAGYDIKKLIME